jgi:hypothetical protein
MRPRNFFCHHLPEQWLLELAVLRMTLWAPGFDVRQQKSVLMLDRLYGIEITEDLAQIARPIKWINHQMNVASVPNRMYFARIPSKSSPHIVHGNALRIDC